jgi:hypothetical protein
MKDPKVRKYFRILPPSLSFVALAITSNSTLLFNPRIERKLLRSHSSHLSAVARSRGIERGTAAIQRDNENTEKKTHHTLPNAYFL